jgi:hypothetical protein
MNLISHLSCRPDDREGIFGDTVRYSTCSAGLFPPDQDCTGKREEGGEQDITADLRQFLHFVRQ